MLPLALSVPMICDGEPLLMRLSVIALLPGWLNRVVSSEPISNPRQSMTALVLLWSTVSVLPASDTDACPADTTPPVGFAITDAGSSTAAANVRQVNADEV